MSAADVIDRAASTVWWADGDDERRDLLAADLYDLVKRHGYVLVAPDGRVAGENNPASFMVKMTVKS